MGEGKRRLFKAQNPCYLGQEFGVHRIIMPFEMVFVHVQMLICLYELVCGCSLFCNFDFLVTSACMGGKA